MTAETLVVAAVALGLGMAGGVALGRLRRSAPAVPPAPDPISEEDTRPTLIPFRTPRESGRNLAKVTPRAADSRPPEP